uniref:Cyclin-related protein FAM58A n=1 Tax=Lygus hesperus TaxID=30085 RepID=A0A146KMF2_LYGHE
MEHTILRVLKFTTVYQTPHNYILHMAREIEAPVDVCHVAYYIVNDTFSSSICVRYQPHVTAVAVLRLALQLCVSGYVHPASALCHLCALSTTCTVCVYVVHSHHADLRPTEERKKRRTCRSSWYSSSREPWAATRQQNPRWRPTTALGPRVHSYTRTHQPV